MNNKLINQLIDYAKNHDSFNLVIEKTNTSLLNKNQSQGNINLSKKQQDDLINTFNILSHSLKDELFSNKKIKIKHQNKIYNCNLSILPANKENKIVMSLEESKLDIKRINSLGFSRQDLKIIKEVLNLKQGLILIAGKATSGKTTSYYSLLNHLNKTHRSFYSLEKYPVCSLPYVSTLNINHRQSLYEYLEKLRKIDADVVGIDHLESPEEIKNAIIQASNGHLIIATIESTDAILALRSCLNIGLSPYQVAKSLRLIIGQKLMKKTCPYCLKTKEIDSNYLNFIKTKTKNSHLIKRAYFSPGCDRCNFSGQTSNFAVYELMKILPDTRIDKDFKTFIYDALEKANNGLFSPETILKSFK
jgi:type IV pilus assembly protein PilB